MNKIEIIKKLKRERELKERERESSVRHSEGKRKGGGKTGYRLLFEIPNDDFREKIFLKIAFFYMK